MANGQAEWLRNGPYYEALTLARNGDRWERRFAQESTWLASIPSYERFWRLHVTPSTLRPRSVMSRPNCHELFSRIAQTSYSVLCSIADSADELEEVRTSSGDRRGRQFRNCVRQCGDALVLFNELQNRFFGGTDAFSKKMKSVSEILGPEFPPSAQRIEHVDSSWKARVEQAKAYRHHLVHHGFLSVRTGRVLRPQFFVGHSPMSWQRALDQHASSPSDWIPVQDACDDVFRESLSLVELGYSTLVRQLQPLLSKRGYQLLWGWTDAEEPTVPPRMLFSYHGSTSSPPPTGDIV